MKAAILTVWILMMGTAGAVVIRMDVGLLGAAELASRNDEGVGWLEISEGAARFRGTGLLVDSQWVVTAAHNWDAGAVTGMSFNFGGEVFSAESWLQHPGRDGSFSPAQGWDVGLIRLDRPVIGATPVALYSGSNELGVEVTFLGAGLAGSPGTGLDFNALARLYAATNVIDRVIPTTSISGTGGLLAFDFDDGSAGRNNKA